MRPTLARISSVRSGFFFCGMALEPVENASGKINESKLSRREKRDLFGKPAQVQADEQ